MNRVELMTVEDCYGLSDGVLLAPNFPVPQGNWDEKSAVVAIIKPDGQEFKTRAQFGVVHFKIAGPAPLDKRWRVVVRLPACERDQVPIGSKLLVPRQIKDELPP